MKKKMLIASVPAALLAGTLTISSTTGHEPATEPDTAANSEEVVTIPYIPGIAPNQLNPITDAPEYVFPASPNALLNLDQNQSNYGVWSQMDSLNDLYQLSETVKLRIAVERLAAAVESQNVNSDD